MLPIEKDTDRSMREIADFVARYTGKKYGFMVLVFPFGESYNKVASYISNTKREDMIKVLREQANILEQKKDIETVEGAPC